MKGLRRFSYFLWYFGHFKVPLIGYLRPQLVKLDDKEVVIKIRLRRRSKNHLNSMYFGALSIGADVAGGLHGFYYADQLRLPISLVFKSFEANFLKRPEADVYFVGQMGEQVKAMIEKSRATGERVNEIVRVTAYVDYPKNPEIVAKFTLELSIKILGSVDNPSPGV